MDEFESEGEQQAAVSPIDQLTDAAFALQKQGDPDGAAKIFEARAAVADGRADGDEMLAYIDARRTSADVERTAAALPGLPGGQEVLDKWGSYAQDNLRMADHGLKELLTRAPQLEPVFNELVSRDARWLEIVAAMTGACVAQGIFPAMPYRGDHSGGPPLRMTPMETHTTVPPLQGAEREAAQSALDELNERVPPGSPGYTNPKHQQKIQALNDRLFGTALVNEGRL